VPNIVESEDRPKAVVKEVTDSDGQTILFIDEIHKVVGAASIARKIYQRQDIGVGGFQKIYGGCTSSASARWTAPTSTRPCWRWFR